MAHSFLRKMKDTRPRLMSTKQKLFLLICVTSRWHCRCSEKEVIYCFCVHILLFFFRGLTFTLSFTHYCVQSQTIFFEDFIIYFNHRVHLLLKWVYCVWLTFEEGKVSKQCPRTVKEVKICLVCKLQA